MRTPAPCASAIASGVLSLIGSATAAMPAATPSNGERTPPFSPPHAKLLRALPSAAYRRLAERESRGCPRARACRRSRPARRGRSPPRNASHGRGRQAARLAPSTIASPIGCSDSCSTPATSASASFSQRLAQRNRSAPDGRASACRSCPPPRCRCRACARSPRHCGTGCRRARPAPSPRSSRSAWRGRRRRDRR